MKRNGKTWKECKNKLSKDLPRRSDWSLFQSSFCQDNSEADSAFHSNHVQLTCDAAHVRVWRLYEERKKERKKLRSTCVATCEYEVSVRLKAELINSRACVIHIGVHMLRYARSSVLYSHPCRTCYCIGDRNKGDWSSVSFDFAMRLRASFLLSDYK